MKPLTHTLSFLGLGLMGVPMARNIITKGHTLTVYNRTPGKAKELTDLGAIEAMTLEEALASDVIITMLTDGQAVYDMIVQHKDSIQSGSILIDMSTIGVEWAERIGNELGEKGIHFIDAPVTGSTPKAITGELTIFIGGDQEIVEKVRPILECMGTNLQYMGGAGTGQAMKLVNNHLVALSMVSLVECIFAGERLGLDRKRILDVLATVPVTSAYHRMKLPMLANGEYPPMFSGDNMLKDIELALSSPGSREELPLLDISEKLYRKIHDLGYGGEDLASIDRLYR